MSTHAGSRNISDNLVFSFDPSNSTSYLNQASTTNFAQDPENMTPWCDPGEGTILSPNSQFAPDGTVTADKVIEYYYGDPLPTIHIFRRTGILTSGITYNVSFYAKAGERNIIGCGGNNALGSCKVNLSTGAVISGSAIVIPLFNGWYKILTTVTPGGGQGIYMGICDASGNNYYVSDESGTWGLFAWGFRAELGNQWNNYTSVAGITLRDTIFDLSSNRYGGGLVKGITYNSANSGYLTLNAASGQYINLGISSGQLDSLVQNFTIQAMVRFANPNDRYAIYSAGYSIGGTLHFGTGTPGTNDGGLEAYVPGVYVARTAGGLLQANTWYHVAYTFGLNNGSDHKFYINGILQTNTLASAATYTVSGVPKWIGARDSATFYNGDLGPVTIYNRVLSNSEIMSNFQSLRGRYGI